MAYESLERYRTAYVDYKTVLQIDISVQAAHDSVNRYKHFRWEATEGRETSLLEHTNDWISFTTHIHPFEWCHQQHKASNWM